MGGRPGGFKGKKTSPLEGRAETLRKEIQEDTAISDITRQELLSQITTENISIDPARASFLQGGEILKPIAILKKARETLDEARLGQDPKFIARQQRSTRRRLLADQPGRGQTILNR